MTSAIRARREAEDGFTLIELLVVVIIIGILAAIAIPAFLNQRERAWQSEVTSAVRNSALEIEAEATQNGGAYPLNAAGSTAVLNFIDTNVSDTDDSGAADAGAADALDDSPIFRVVYVGTVTASDGTVSAATAPTDPTGFYLCMEHDLVNDVGGTPTNSVAYRGGAIGSGLQDFAEQVCADRTVANAGDAYVAGGVVSTQS